MRVPATRIQARSATRHTVVRTCAWTKPASRASNACSRPAKRRGSATQSRSSRAALGLTRNAAAAVHEIALELLERAEHREPAASDHFNRLRLSPSQQQIHAFRQRFCERDQLDGG